MGLLVTVLGTHEGVGTTTVALNLAAALADVGRRTVRLVELDDTLGHLAGDLGVQAAGDVADAATFAGGMRGSGDVGHELLPMLTPLGPGLSGLLAVTPAHRSPRTRHRISGPDTARLLEALRDGADVVVDTPAVYDDPVVAALGMSDRVVVVTSPEGPALEALGLTLETLELMHVPDARTVVVLNHAGAGGTGAGDGDAASAAGVPVSVLIPESPDLEGLTTLVAVEQPDHPLAHSVRQLAQVLRTPGPVPGGSVGRLLRRRAH